ncbi:MAG: hypothetical protein RIQ99_364 [Pseudomonadota bacterium]|jgi:hypothetical protein
MTGRLPAHLEVAGLRRAVDAAGGFASVLHKGEREAGTILVVLIDKGQNPRVFERMPSLDPARNGDRIWTLIYSESPDNAYNTAEYLARRAAQDSDLWIIELDIADGERLIGLTGGLG